MILLSRSMVKLTCKLGINFFYFLSSTISYIPFNRLGITQHLIAGGIARLEEVRSAAGELENLYVKVCRGSPMYPLFLI
jgi:hypothetical protein